MELISLQGKALVFLRKSDGGTKRSPTPEEHEEWMRKMRAPGPKRELTPDQHAEITKPRGGMKPLAWEKKWFTKEHDRGKGIGKAIKNPTGISGSVKACPTCGEESYMHPKDTQCEDCEKKDIRRTMGMGKGIQIVVSLRKAARSVAQRRLMGACEHGADWESCPKHMTKKQMHDFAVTKERGLPEHVAGR